MPIISFRCDRLDIFRVARITGRFIGRCHGFSVSKKADQAYVSGKNVAWIKVKTAVWREANKGRWGLFQRIR